MHSHPAIWWGLTLSLHSAFATAVTTLVPPSVVVGPFYNPETGRADQLSAMPFDLYFASTIAAQDPPPKYDILDATSTSTTLLVKCQNCHFTRRSRDKLDEVVREVQKRPGEEISNFNDPNLVLTFTTPEDQPNVIMLNGAPIFPPPNPRSIMDAAWASLKAEKDYLLPRPGNRPLGFLNQVGSRLPKLRPIPGHVTIDTIRDNLDYYRVTGDEPSSDSNLWPVTSLTVDEWATIQLGPGPTQKFDGSPNTWDESVVMQVYLREISGSTVRLPVIRIHALRCKNTGRIMLMRVRAGLVDRKPVDHGLDSLAGSGNRKCMSNPLACLVKSIMQADADLDEQAEPDFDAPRAPKFAVQAKPSSLPVGNTDDDEELDLFSLSEDYEWRTDATFPDTLSRTFMEDLVTFVTLLGIAAVSSVLTGIVSAAIGTSVWYMFVRIRTAVRRRRERRSKSAETSTSEERDALMYGSYTPVSLSEPAAGQISDDNHLDLHAREYQDSEDGLSSEKPAQW